MKSIITSDRRRMLRTGLTRAVVVAAFAAAAAPSAFAQLNRTGPVGALGYPEWYQDKTGLTLEFCDNRTQAELQGGWCVLLPPDLATGAAPETRTGTPVNFADEHFYYLVNGGATGVIVQGQTTPAFRVVLVAGIEGAFGGGPVKAGDEMVFARLRIRVDPVPFNGTYTVYTPFGKRVFEDQVAGDRLFATDDVGLTPGNFQEALNGSIYPFLVPSATPGGLELPPVSASNPAPDTNPLHFAGGAPTAYPNNGRRYIGDPARIGPITGSKANFTADGIGDPNLLRIDVDGPDVPNGHMTIFQSVDFTVTGRIFEGAMPGDVNIDRASYARGGASGEKLDVFATATPITKGRIPGEAPTAPIPSSLVYYNAACTPTLDLGGNPGPPYQAPATGARVTLLNSGTTFFGQYGVLPAGLDGCLEASATTTDGQATTVYMPIHLTDQLTISDASYDAAGQTLTVRATSSDATVKLDSTPVQTLTVPGFGNLINGQLVVGQLLAPPATIAVTSSGGGSNTRQVTTGVPTTSGSGTTTTTPPEQPVAPIATNVAAATTEGLATSFTLTSDTSVSVVLVTNGVLGTAVVNGAGVTYTPNPNASGNDAFAYQLRTASGLTSNTATVTVAIAPLNDPPTAVAETVSAIAGVANNFNLLGNDTDPDGLLDLSTIVIDGADARLGSVAVSGGIATFTPQALPAGVASDSMLLTYHAVDSKGAASPSVTDTVRVFATESIVPTRWQYTTSQGRWVVTGTVSPAQAQTMSITYASGTYNVWNTATSRFACTGNAAGQLIGRAVTDATATWTLDQGGTSPNSILNPTNSNNNATSPDGRSKTSFWCTTPTLRITSSTTGASVTTSAVQVK
jgi:hypothetical protein